MKTVSNYDKFSENYRLNENLAKKAWGSIISYFKKKYEASWIYYVLFLKKTGNLPKGFEVISYSVDESDVPSSEEELKLESFKDAKLGVSMINEEVITLRHNDPNMRNVDVSELAYEVEKVYNMNIDRIEEGEARKKMHALYIWGAPGIGKTEILHQLAKKLKIEVIECHLSQIEPTDFRGVPKVENVVPGSSDTRDERTVTKVPAFFPWDNGPNGNGGIMFFDEINRAPKMVLSAALSLCLAGTVGDYKLPEKWIVIAAGNRPEDLGGGVATEIEPALSNRFKHVNYAPTLQSWIDWALTKPKINPDLIAFLTFNKDYFHKLDPDESRQNWPSPRTWELASEEEYFERKKNWKNPLSYERIANIYTDLVGRAAATTFKEYLQLKEHFNEKDVQEVYEKGAAAKRKPPTRIDQANAAAASIAFWKKGEKLTPKELTNVLEFALSLDNVESKTSMISFLKMVHPEIREQDPWRPIYWEYVKKWHKGIKEMEDDYKEMMAKQ